MAVDLHVGDRAWSVGRSDFLFAFFSTVGVRLEPEGWSTRFPVLMGDLYAGRVLAASAERGRAELEEIRAELAQHPPSDVVWDAEHPERRPPWGDEIAATITDLGNYFVTNDGRDLLDVLAEALGHAARSGQALTIA